MLNSACCFFADLMAFRHSGLPGISLANVSMYIDCFTSSSIRATSLAMVTTALLFSSCVQPSTNSFLAYQSTKSSSSMLSRIFLLVQNESGSFFEPLPVKGISLTVTSKPFSRANKAFLITAAMPVPYDSPCLGGSASGRKHSFDVRRLSTFSWFTVHAEPSDAATLLAPMACSLNTSGAPSTRKHLFSLTAARVAR